MTESDPQPITEPVRPERKSGDELAKLDKAALIENINSLFEYFDAQKIEDVQALRESEEKCRLQLADVTRRENMLLKSLTEKEREISDLAAQIEELKQYQLPSNNQLRTMLLEPTVNVVINRLRKELDSTKLRLEESQSELNAWKFTQDSQTGKQLMARCRTLLKENEELGKQISQGRIAKLEGEIALEKKLVEEMKVAQDETEQFVMELDDDTEGLQATIYLLQHQLKEARDRIDVLEGGGEPVTQDQELTDSVNHVAQSLEQPAAETMDHETTPLVTDDSTHDKPLTIAAQKLNQVTDNLPTSDASVMVNGTTDSEAELVKSAEKVTAGEDKTLTSAPLGSNGHAEMAVTN